MKTENKIIWIAASALVIIVSTCSACSVNQKASGTVKTENKVNADVNVIVDFPICNRQDWNYDQVMHCIDLCNEYEIKATTDENFGKVLEVMKETSGAEDAIAPSNIMGVI
jgi:protein involved in sex pheromone biosynthesis